MLFSDAKLALAARRSKGDTGLIALIEALQATGKASCIHAADRLRRIPSRTSAFDLHLRGAGLERHDAVAIAKGLSQLSPSQGPMLRSFSVSYNPGLSDAGAMVIIAALPESVSEIGLVGCELGDALGSSLLARVPEFAGLRMICVEENDFSLPTILAFKRLASTRLFVSA